MKRFATLLCLCMLAIAMPAFAQSNIPGQLYLNFDDCTSSARNKDLDCTSTISTTILCATAKPGVEVNSVLADLGYIDFLVGSDPASLPPWWQFYSGGCSGSARIIFSAAFTVNNICTDIWLGLGATAGQWGGAQGPVPDGNRARVKWTTNVLSEQVFTIPAGQESYIEKITLHQAPAAACAGCNTPVCSVYLSEQLYMLAGGFVEISGGAAGTDMLSLNDANPSLPPCNSEIVPTTKSTWGQVKSLYR